MNKIAKLINGSNTLNSGFDLFRLSKSKEAVDISPNTIRAYNREGLPLYRRGKAVFVSRLELTEFLCR
jgi:hypothetical protein